MPDDPIHPDQLDGAARFRADLVTYLDSLPIGELAELLGELPRSGVLDLVSTTGSLAVLMRWEAGRGLVGLDDDELAHHAVVLVLEQVAVEHVRHGWVGVVGEPDQQPGGAGRRG